MGTTGTHITRTLLVSRKHPNLIAVSLGSEVNLDLESIDPALGRAAVKVFDLRAVPSGGYDYATQGHMLAYGARNEIGLAEDGAGNVWGVENSADQLTRTKNGVSTDVHIDNPGEKLHNCEQISSLRLLGLHRFSRRCPCRRQLKQ